MLRYRPTARLAVPLLTLGLAIGLAIGLAAMTTSAAPHRHGPVTFGSGPVHQHGPAHYGNGTDHRHAPGVYRTHPESASAHVVPAPPGVASPVIIVSPYLRLDRHDRWRFDRHDRRRFEHHRRGRHGESRHWPLLQREDVHRGGPPRLLRPSRDWP